MAAPDLSLVKAWCRIDGAEFDDILPTLIASATAMASHETGVDYTTATMPESVKHWLCAHVKYWLDAPDAAGEREMVKSPFLAGLLDPYRTFNWTPPTA